MIQTSIQFLSILLLLHSPYPSNSLVISPKLQTSHHFSTSNDQTTTLDEVNVSIKEATNVLKSYDEQLNAFIQSDGNQGLGGGISATKYWKEELSKENYVTLRQALVLLSNVALRERSRNTDEGYGRVMLGICASCIEDAIGALKGYVPSLNIPRGLLHG